MARAYIRRTLLPAPPGQYSGGIYAIINNETGKVYVGSSVDMRHRWTEHRCELEDGRHGNRYLQRAFLKRPDALSFEVIEECQESELIAREQFWIDFYQSFLAEKGYNIARKAESCAGIRRDPAVVARVARSLMGYKHTARARANMSAAQRAIMRRKPRDEQNRMLMRMLGWGRKWTDDQHRKRKEWFRRNPDFCTKPVIQLSLDGDVIARFSSIKEAESAVAGKRTNIHAVCKGKRRHCLGFSWKYA